jgi:hypothetical protein
MKRKRTDEKGVKEKKKNIKERNKRELLKGLRDQKEEKDEWRRLRRSLMP